MATAVAASIPAVATSANDTPWVVDDDHAQCPDAEFETIQKAVDQATKKNNDKSTDNDVDLITVCPGLYEELVSVKTPVTIRGVPETVSAIDCFSATPPALDPSTLAIVVAPPDAPTDAQQTLFDLQADSIDLQGFVMPGLSNTLTPSRGAIQTSVEHSGYRVHDNLIMSHTLAVVARSNGTLETEFDHNCLRDNGWGFANDWLPLVNARFDHNSSMGTRNFVYEQTSNCPEILATPPDPSACREFRVAMQNVAFDHNTSAADNTQFRLAASVATTLVANTASFTRFGIRLVGANQGLEITDNIFEVRQVGIARQSTPPVPPNIGAIIQGNTITQAFPIWPTGPYAGIGLGQNGLQNSQILDNVITGFAGEGLALLSGNTGNLVRGNTVLNNRWDGVRVATGATGNTFDANEMLGNGIANPPTGTPIYFDANDAVRAFNIWTGNVCVTDNPAGTICGVQ